MFTCEYCGRKSPDVVLHVDHIKPRSKGGGNNIDNLVTACSSCNTGKGIKNIDDGEFRESKSPLDKIHIIENLIYDHPDKLDRYESDLMDLKMKCIYDTISVYGYCFDAMVCTEIDRWIDDYHITTIMIALHKSFTKNYPYGHGGSGDVFFEKTIKDVFNILEPMEKEVG